MDTNDGFELLRRAVESATSRRASDCLDAHRRGPRFVAGLADVARAVQRAVDAANVELGLLGLNGYECEVVLSAILRGLEPPPYWFGEDDTP
jgi:hypothetical protein